MMYDFVIRNARIIDGANTPWFRSDVAIKNNLIAKIGCLRGESAKEIVDAQDHYLAPGFIDIHTHSDATLMIYPTSESRVLQGITTEIGGACGISVAPVNPKRRDQLANYLHGYLGDLAYDWGGIGEFLDRVEAVNPSINFGMTVGHGTVRIAVMDFDNRQAAKTEISEMQQYVHRSMQDGAFGISSGLMYAPGIFSDIDEMAKVVEAVRPFGGFYETHLRDENDKGMLLEAISEALEVCKRTGVPLQLSHHKVSGADGWHVFCRASCAMIERARMAGLDVTADQYPYSAACTGITSFLPNWTLEGGMDGLSERLRDLSTRSQVKAETSKNCHNLWDKLVVSTVVTEKNAWMVGKSIETIAQDIGCDPADTILDIVIEEGGACSVIELSMCEEDVEYIMKQRFVMIGSDGMSASLNAKNLPLLHPRGFGAFAKMLGYYCRDRGLFPLETAISKMTGMPAARIGLNDRGLVKEGMHADLVLFDLATVNGRATFENPMQGADGILQVYVNGVLTAKDGAHTGARAGKILRKSS